MACHKRGVVNLRDGRRRDGNALLVKGHRRCAHGNTRVALLAAERRAFGSATPLLVPSTAELAASTLAASSSSAVVEPGLLRTHTKPFIPKWRGHQSRDAWKCCLSRFISVGVTHTSTPLLSLPHERARVQRHGAILEERLNLGRDEIMLDIELAHVADPRLFDGVVLRRAVDRHQYCFLPRPRQPSIVPALPRGFANDDITHLTHVAKAAQRTHRNKFIHAFDHARNRSNERAVASHKCAMATQEPWLCWNGLRRLPNAASASEIRQGAGGNKSVAIRLQTLAVPRQLGACAWA